MMMKRSSGVSRAAVRAAAKPAATRGDYRQEPAGNIDYMFDLPTGLDALDKSEGIEEHEYTVPFDVICLFDEVIEGSVVTRKNVRFCTSGRSITDKSGVKHRMVTDFRPLVTAEELAKLPSRDEDNVGTLTVKLATLGTNDIKWTPFQRYGRYTGDLKVEFTCLAKFVSFVGKSNHAGEVDDPEQQG